jgi:fructose-1,6-bisphosphatase/inositol monophosphatase family enzyme
VECTLLLLKGESVSALEESFVVTALQLVREVLPVILAAAAADSRTPTLKPDGSFVTETDTAVERHLSQGFAHAFPGIPVLGEEMATAQEGEGSANPEGLYSSFLRSPNQIILDPIDGTKNFVEGGKPFCVAVALTRSVGDGVWPIASVVALPFAGVIFWTTGHEVVREVFASGAEEKVQRRAVFERRISVNSSDRGWLAKHGFEMKLPWVSSGSSVHDFMETATGELCGSMVGKQRLWDLMAPLAIAERLGCVLRDLSTGEVLSCVRPCDLSRDISHRAWGIERKMMIAPRETEVSSLIAPL